MTLKTVDDKFEYLFQNLSSSINSTITLLNKLGANGWEVFDFQKPKSTGDTYKAWLKRKVIEVKV